MYWTMGTLMKRDRLKRFFFFHAGNNMGMLEYTLGTRIYIVIMISTERKEESRVVYLTGRRTSTKTQARHEAQAALAIIVKLITSRVAR